MYQPNGEPLAVGSYGTGSSTCLILQFSPSTLNNCCLAPLWVRFTPLTCHRHLLIQYSTADAASGVLQIKIESARGLQGVKLGGGTPDPYVSISVANRAEIAKTKFKRSSYVSQHLSIFNHSY